MNDDYTSTTAMRLREDVNAARGLAELDALAPDRTTLRTLAEGRTTLSGLHDLDMLVPVADLLTAQGDLLLRRTVDRDRGGEANPPGGTVLVEGEHDHTIHGDCTVRTVQGDLTVAYVEVPDGGVAYLLHPEHGGQGLGPGCWEVRRQQETRGAVMD